MKSRCLPSPAKFARPLPTAFTGFLARLHGCALAFALALPFGLAAADQSDVAAAPPIVALADTNAPVPDFLRNYLQLQEQLHSAQLAIERNRREAADAAARNAEAITERLQTLEQRLADRSAAERRQFESTHRLLLLVGGGCVSIGFFAMLLTAYFQWRAVGRLTEFSMLSQATLTTGRGVLPAPGVETAGALANQNDNRLNEVLARIERQVRELENASHAPHGGGSITLGDTVSASSTALPVPKSQRLAVLVAKGQSLLDLDQPEEALSVFNDILTLDPGHTETLVKKGDTLERLGRLDEAIDCYDAAIAADANFTVAYLHKGGLFNRMDRHAEALKCYEEALRTQEKNQVA